jgi:hypothetical protein
MVDSTPLKNTKQQQNQNPKESTIQNILKFSAALKSLQNLQEGLNVVHQN